MNNFLQVRELKEVHELAEIRQMNFRDLPEDSEIIKLLKDLEKEGLHNERLWCIFVLFTGRRFRDIERLNWENVCEKDGIVSCMLPKDKAHQNKVITFSFKLNSWNLDLNINSEKRLIKTFAASGTGKVVTRSNSRMLTSKKQKLQRRSKTFTLHSLRNRHALKLLIAGKSAEEVLDIIGWESMNSLQRYVILSPEQIAKFENYQECYEFILRNRKIK